MFPSANTAIPNLIGMPRLGRSDRTSEFNEGVMRVDLFGVKRRAAPSTASSPRRCGRTISRRSCRGTSYLLETVIRTVKMGHVFTQGTSDSNEVWLDVTVASGDRVIGRSGGLANDGDGVDDVVALRQQRSCSTAMGNRIDRRNAEDIFTALYNHQIPPGAADVVHYRFSAFRRT